MPDAHESGGTATHVLVGLGNPGPEYAATRHNVGFRVADAAAEALGAGGYRQTPEGWIATAARGGRRLLLLKPRTYMNRSGEAVAALLDSMREEPPPENLLVVTDDVHLSVGRMRFRRRGGSGGHNGLASVEAALGGPGYPRLRLGVGAAAGPALIDHVLGPFSPAEEAILAETIPVAAEAVGAWWARGLEACQNRYNGWVAPGAARAERDDQTEPPAADS